MDLRSILSQQVRKHNVKWETVEQDYLLSWVLFGITLSSIQNQLVFKGGTALKKIYFGNYRFSQDLDFTALNTAPRENQLEEAISKSCMIAQELLQKRKHNINITCARYTEKNPHPNEQEAFVIRAQFPWHRYHHVRIMVEVTHNHTLANKPILHKILHDYPETMEANILCYSINEIFGEKLIAMCQNAKKLHEQGWSRSRARDYYDLWRLINSFSHKLHSDNIIKTINKYENVSISGIHDFFDEKALRNVERDWQKWLSPLIWPLPSYNEVIPELKLKISKLLNLS